MYIANSYTLLQVPAVGRMLHKLLRVNMQWFVPLLLPAWHLRLLPDFHYYEHHSYKHSVCFWTWSFLILSQIFFPRTQNTNVGPHLTHSMIWIYYFLAFILAWAFLWPEHLHTYRFPSSLILHSSLLNLCQCLSWGTFSFQSAWSFLVFEDPLFTYILNILLLRLYLTFPISSEAWFHSLLLLLVSAVTCLLVSFLPLFLVRYSLPLNSVWERERPGATEGLCYFC